MPTSTDLITARPRNPARVEVWAGASFARRSLALERGAADPGAYELLRGGHAQPQALLLHWRLPVTVAAVAVGFAVFKDDIFEPRRGSVVLEYWDGRHWQRLQARPATDDSALTADAVHRRFGVRRWVWNFAAVTTLRLRFGRRAAAGDAGQPIIIRRIECHEAALALPAPAAGAPPAARRPAFVGLRLPGRRLSAAERCRIDHSGRDLLGRRLLQRQGEPDYATVAAALYPLDFHKSALGRCDDGNETMVTWNGTLILLEGIAAAAWNHYTAESMAAGWTAGDGPLPVPLVMAGMEKLMDRWFAFAVGLGPGGPELVGTHLGRTQQAWLAGWQPGLCTTYRQSGVTYTITALVVPAPSTPYLNIVEIQVTNSGAAAVDTAVTVIMGRHPSEAMHETAHFATVAGPCPGRDPLFCAPQPTGYQLDADACTVRNPAGEIMLHSSRPGEFGGTDLECTFSVPVHLGPGATQTLQLRLPGVDAPRQTVAQVTAPDHDLAAFGNFWTQALTAHTGITTPERRVNDCQRQALAQILIGMLNRGKLKYGSYWYEEYYGVEEPEAVLALAKYGYAKEAQAALEIMLSAAALDPDGYHHQYRHGVAVQTVAEVHALTADLAWLERVAPRLEAVGDWIVGAIGSAGGRFAGLLPKRTYGGDISTPARNLSTNTRCWRGLRDAGLLLQELGRDRPAARFLEQAARYRDRLLALMQQLVDRRGRYPFLPMGFDIGQPGSRGRRDTEKRYPSLSQESMGAYWHIFAIWILRSGIVEPASAEARWITDYIENRGGLLLGLLRLGKRQPAAPVDIDAHYGLSYIQALLARGEREKFLLSFYGLLAHGMSRQTFSAPESSGIFPLRADPAAWNASFRETRWEWGANRNHYLTEPLSSGATAVVLSLLRDLLVYENPAGGPAAAAALHLLAGAPAAWLQPGKAIAVHTAPTSFGPVSLQTCAPRRQRLEIDITGHWRRSAPKLLLHLPAAAGRVARLTANGQRLPVPASGPLRLPPTPGPTHLEVQFETA